MRAALAWMLYGLGDFISKIDYLLPDTQWTTLYRPYGWLMLRSLDIQGDGPGPWAAARPSPPPSGLVK